MAAPATGSATCVMEPEESKSKAAKTAVDDMLCDGLELSALIDRYVNGRKAERNRAILKAVYLKGLTYEEAAELCEVSAVHVSRIVHRYGDPILLMMKK